ncbi:Short-chain dehydrogenase/reductase SDR [Penicillium cf. griseofulvum]|uniref:Short-chain dehydrogenase/reductase SDR n=1 Tax=Penicillium cf. griseofulvum TaxID=2972120 RepID=A0A9W9N136_9EURO|nr:Short-chain dehydrogenase/reductase SDR [Penicillium cf. griseofulvum]KAJ5422679.1 Short-chain dehydrogenase/reductase SDR [Penicillium cf. griseofulvum]KAJ5428854.1 Short-chain dehydrogenase/reductase SDR [Penicillium cf. griseofulvum]
MTSNILILGATRGLGASLRTLYSAKTATHVFATSRSSNPEPSAGVTWLTGIDISKPDVGEKLVFQLPPTKLSTVIVTAGYFGFETFESPNWEKQVQMYTTSAIGPVFVIHNLVKAGLLDQGSKVILVSSESGSITLRHEQEGGGNFGHHASKAALNMVGKLLSLDLKSKGIAVGLVHPGFMRTEMTKSVGFDKYWDAGGAVTPDQAAKTLASFIEGFDIGKTGEFWAPAGPRDIGTAEAVLGKNLPTPLQLPW